MRIYKDAASARDRSYDLLCIARDLRYHANVRAWQLGPDSAHDLEQQARHFYALSGALRRFADRCHRAELRLSFLSGR